MYIYLKHSGVFGFPMIATGIFNDFVVGNKGGSVIEPRTSLSFSFPSIQERLWRQRKKDVHRFGVFARMKLHHFAHWKIICGEICSRVLDPGELFFINIQIFSFTNSFLWKISSVPISLQLFGIVFQSRNNYKNPEQDQLEYFSLLQVSATVATFLLNSSTFWCGSSGIQTLELWSEAIV